MREHTLKIGVSLAIAVAIACTLIPLSALAAGGGGGENAPIILPGVHFYAGDAGKSVTGTTGYVLDLQSEQRKGVIRPAFAAEITMASGTASIDTDEPQFSLWGAGFLGGGNLFFFTSGRFQPYLGTMAVVSWNQLKLPTPPANVEKNTQALAFGYELNAGIDMRLGSADGNAIRIQSSYWSVSTTLAGVSGFMMSGFRLSLGIVY